jgi:hypothetical protein
LSAEERGELKVWIDLYKRFRRLLHGGRAYQLSTRPLASRNGHGVVGEGTGAGSLSEIA